MTKTIRLVLAGLLAGLSVGPAVAEGPTTFDHFEAVERPELPSVLEAVSNAPELGPDRVVVFPINVWGGWAPLIAANRGFEPNERSVFFQKYGFKVKLKVIEDASELLGAYVSGQTPILWGTVDMLVLFAQQLAMGPRFKVFQQVDWSRGGDGIVVRKKSVRTANDLRGKTIALAAFSPSHFYALTVLRAAGIRHDEVKFFYTKTAFGAARAFYEKEEIDAVATFAPDIYTLTEGELAETFRVLTSTGDAQRLIADAWAVREEFARQNPDVVKGLVRGVFEGMRTVQDDPRQVAVWMFEGYEPFDIPSPQVCQELMGDAHLTNYAENRDFFLNEKNPTNFERTWSDAVEVWTAQGALETPVAASSVADPSILLDPEVQAQFKDILTAETVEYAEVPELELEASLDDAVLTMTVYFDAAKEEVDPDSAEVRLALEQIARLAGKFAGASIVVAGYTDPISSGLLDLQKRRDDNRQVPRIIAAYERRLVAFSEVRAKFVKSSLTERFDLVPQQFYVMPRGGENPVTSDPKERWKNRRVEVTVVPLED